MLSTADTIVAIATPPGRGGLGVVRLSGSDAERIARLLIQRAGPLIPRHATLATFESRDSPVVDQVIVTSFPSPASYTGEDVVEISAHGSPVVLRAILQAAIDHGARLAEPGEFTLRAFLLGRIDLMQAEAVADLIDAVTPRQARAAFDQLSGTLTTTIREIDLALFQLIAKLEASVDFPEEGYHFLDPDGLGDTIDGLRVRTAKMLASARRGRMLREGLQVAIVGPTNAGKSSLFNALLGVQRAIVTSVPGTTRDLVTETLDLGGLQVTLVDTAGLRDTADPVESEGISRSRGAIDVADLILFVSDLSQIDAPGPDTLGPADGRRMLVVGTKSDLPIVRACDAAVHVSAKTGEGIDELRRRILAALDAGPDSDVPALTNIRHIALVERADAALRRAHQAMLADGRPLSEEFVLADLQEARVALEEITGQRTTDDLLAEIFSRFCVGK
jgi:tRNA modification GTPase